ncbi:MAG: nucleoside hydrolase [Acidimicrobiia bacterium]
MVRLWIDTDVLPNPDDAVALLAATAHSEIDLVGISVVGDDPGIRATRARKLLAAGSDACIPVATTGLEQACRDADPDLILAIGPLTNIAELAAGTTVPVVAMGGLLRPREHRGRLRRVESNFAADPRAAAGLLASSGSVTIVTLDATAGTALSGAEVGELLALAPSLGPFVEPWPHPVHLHDPAALLVAAGEDGRLGARRQWRRLAVEADGRLVDHPGGTPRPLITTLHAGAVGRRVIDVLAHTGRTGHRAPRRPSST